jgi:hypothetical protein
MPDARLLFTLWPFLGFYYSEGAFGFGWQLLQKKKDLRQIAAAM